MHRSQISSLHEEIYIEKQTCYNISSDHNIDTEISSVPFISISMICDKMPELQHTIPHLPTSTELHEACLHLHGTTRNSASKFILFYRRNTTIKIKEMKVFQHLKLQHIKLFYNQMIRFSTSWYYMQLLLTGNIKFHIQRHSTSSII